MFFNKKDLCNQIRDLENKLKLETQAKNKLEEQYKAEISAKLAEMEKLKFEQAELRRLTAEKEVAQKNQIKLEKQSDRGRELLNGFKAVAPYLDKVIGRSFLLTIAEEFDYKNAKDLSELDFLYKEWLKIFNNIDTFRDEVKKDHSFRVTFAYSSKDYQLNTPDGPKSFQEIQFPKNLVSGSEVNSMNKSAIYLALKNKKMESSVLSAEVYGAPLLSYAFPVFDDQGIVIGAISFSNDITQIIEIAKSLGDVVSSDNDKKLQQLSHLLQEELAMTVEAVQEVREESELSQKLATEVNAMGKEIIEITEKLKVLALNTAIEATKITGSGGKGINIIASQMRNISEQTRKTLKDIFEKNNQLNFASKKVKEHSVRVKESTIKLKEESGVLFNTSTRISSQKDELDSLVRMSIDEIAQNQEDLNSIFMLIKNQKQAK